MSAERGQRPTGNIGNWTALGLAIAVSIPWSWIAITGSHAAGSNLLVALLSGVSILGAAFLLSWAVETAEMDLPESLAVTILALVAVLPEYAVDATFAWKAATDPQQAAFAVANMTGGNRLLLGLGWSTLVFLAWARFGKSGIELPRKTGIDISILWIASFVAFLPVWRGAITLVDTAIFLFLFVLYVFAALRAHQKHGEDEEPVLIGPSALLGSFEDGPRRTLLIIVLLWSCAVIFLAAEPFAESLVHTGQEFGLNEFLLVQWVAPLASEAPEFVVASLLVLRGQITKGMLALVSSKVNQWTLLVGTLPVVTSISGGRVMDLPMDGRQQQEVFLTAAQSIFGVAVLANLELTRWQAMMLAGLFVGGLVATTQETRAIFSWFYLISAAVIILCFAENRNGLKSSFKFLIQTLRRN